MTKTIYSLKLTNPDLVEIYRGLYQTTEEAKSAGKDFATLGFEYEIIRIVHNTL